AGGGQPARAADDLVPQRLVVAKRGAEAHAAPARARRGGDRGQQSGDDGPVPLLRRRRGAPLYRERDQYTASGRRAQPDRVRQGRNQRLRRPWPQGGGEPRAHRDEGGRALRDHGRPRRVAHLAPAVERRGPFELDAGGSRRAVHRLRRSLRRQAEADEFYASVIPEKLDADAANVMRQAIAGMLWSKQFYYYDVDTWLSEHGANPFNPGRRAPRNEHWHHMHNAHIISMPDKWEYPWYAAWDLAFHVLALSLADDDFAKGQLDLMLGDQYLHPSGQLPAYEWNFGDVNPPVHAWSTMFIYRLEKLRRGKGDLDWLERSFHKLMLNFTWWVNRKDRTGNNAFEGGFLGLDNIGVFDRSSPLPTGGHLEQADGTAWMALFAQNMLDIASELAAHRPAYQEMVLKFAQHFLWIASAMMRTGQDVGMWDEEDGFFYDVLRHPDGRSQRLKVRSMVGLLPLCAVTVFDGQITRDLPELGARLSEFLLARPELRRFIHDPLKPGCADRHMASILD